MLCTVVSSHTTDPRPGFCHGWRLVMPACERYSAAEVPPVRCNRACSGRDARRDKRRGERAVEGWDW